jgi:hypothetical protein
MNNIIIGVTGFARSGKDTFFQESSRLLSKAKCHRYAFADALKEESDDFLKKHVGISAFTEEAEDKELIRPFLVTYGTHLRRKLDPSCWIKKVEQAIEDNHKSSRNNIIFITDVRFENEAQWVKSIGGIITKVTREGVKAANQDEHVQSALIEKYVDLRIMWPTYKPGDIKESHTLLKPVLKKNFRNYVEY